ncbi:MAG: SWIM zinc finger family protein [Chloroflexi bacterium]|nr:SWIM zinc finger family protein [Chloroflexota bacterium]
MSSSLIGKVEKAKRYAQEKGRVTFSALAATFQGEHDNYTLEFSKGKWRCSCRFFSQHGLCSHTMALQKILEEMLPEEAPTPTSVA